MISEDQNEGYTFSTGGDRKHLGRHDEEVTLIKEVGPFKVVVQVFVHVLNAWQRARLRERVGVVDERLGLTLELDELCLSKDAIAQQIVVKEGDGIVEMILNIYEHCVR